MIVAIGFILGVIITISEPDLQVLAGQVAAVPNMVLILSVAVGVGVFLVAALLRILFGIPLAPLLLVFYAIVFALAMFVPLALYHYVQSVQYLQFLFLEWFIVQRVILQQQQFLK